MRALTARDHLEAWLMLSALEIALTESTNITVIPKGFDAPIHVPELVKSVVFSDTIILYSNADSPSDFLAIYTAVVTLFGAALHRRVPIRIGISKGVFYSDEQRSMYAGPALIEAYDIGEASQWLGIVLSASVANDSITQNLRSGASKLVVDWDVHTKNGVVRSSVANWPVALKNNFKIEPPITPQQLYQVFEKYFESFSTLSKSVAAKYINTAKFINTQLSLHKQS